MQLQNIVAMAKQVTCTFNYVALVPKSKGKNFLSSFMTA